MVFDPLSNVTGFCLSGWTVDKRLLSKHSWTKAIMPCDFVPISLFASNMSRISLPLPWSSQMNFIMSIINYFLGLGLMFPVFDVIMCSWWYVVPSPCCWGIETWETLHTVITRRAPDHFCPSIPCNSTCPCPRDHFLHPAQPSRTMCQSGSLLFPLVCTFRPMECCWRKTLFCSFEIPAMLFPCILPVHLVDSSLCSSLPSQTHWLLYHVLIWG